MASEKRRKYSHAYYERNKEKILAYAKSYREAHKGETAKIGIGGHARDLLRKLASEDGISLAAEVRRLVLREHAIRTLARGNR